MRTTARMKCLTLPLLVVVLFAGGCGKDDVERRTVPRPRTAPNPGVNMNVAKENQLLNTLVNNPDDVEARLLLAHLYFDTNRPALAIPPYEVVLEARPDDPNIRTDLGTCYKRTGQLEKARAEFERVTRQHPKHVQSAYNLGVVLAQMGQLEAAVAQWERVAQISTDPRVTEAARRHAQNARQRLGK